MNVNPVRAGRPRSEQARTAVLHAVDDLLVEVGYGALTMKGIAERAGVGRQTVYRWWSTKAEVLFEATIADAAQELVPEPQADALSEIIAFLDGVARFLVVSPAGAGYRALMGEAQHDAEVARLMSTVAIFDAAAHAVLDRLVAHGELPHDVSRRAATVMLIGPVYYRALEGGTRADLDITTLAAAMLSALRHMGGPPSN